MALISTESLERIRDAVDFVELVGQRTELRQAGPRSYEGLCPFHEERTPSFTIQPDRKVYYCFGCQASGDVFRYVQTIEGLDFPGAVALLADRCGLDIEYEDEDPAAAARRNHYQRLHTLVDRASLHYARLLWESSEAAATRAYLEGRGLGAEVLHDFRIGFAPSARDHVRRFATTAGFTDDELLAVGLTRRRDERTSDYFRERIMFPLGDARGRMIGFGARAIRDGQRPKYLNTPEGPLYRKGRHLYGLDRARPHATRDGLVIVVEGYTDVLALHQAQIANTVGLMGTALTDDQLGELSRLARTVLLCLDGDSAGEEAMNRAAAAAVAHRLELRIAPLPDGSDPASIAQAGGRGAITAALQRAIPVVRFQLDRILAAGEHHSGEGRDRTLERLRPLFATIPPSATRLELMQAVGDALQLPASLLEQTLSGPQRPAGDSPRTTPAIRLSREEEHERSLLALCIALPDRGRELLDALDLAQHFTSDPLRRAAERIAAADLGAQDADLGEDRDLADVLSGLLAQADREQATPARLEAAHQRLHVAALERQLRSARTTNDPAAPAIAVALAAAKERFEAAYARAINEDR